MKSSNNLRLRSSRLSVRTRLALAGILAVTIALSYLPAKAVRAKSESPSPSAAPAEAMPTLEGDKAIDHLKQQGTYDSLQEAMAAVKYQAQWQPAPRLEGVGAGYELKNAANNLLAYVDANGLQATSLEEAEKPWRLGLELKDYGYGDSLLSMQAGEVTAKGNRVSIQKSAVGNPQSSIEEWYVNSSRGIEQGFTIARRPTMDHRAATANPLRLRMAVTGDLQAAASEARSGATFTREADNVLLTYDKLFVTDAKGRVVSALMRLDGRDLILDVEDWDAEYPLTIDPLLRELTKLTASDGAAGDQFGFSVAISGDTVVVGAYQDGVGANAHQGSAYVFVRTGVSWTQQAKLTAADGAANDQFGNSVAISGDTAVVGAYLDDVGANANQGSAYIFVRSGVSWTQLAKLTASDGAAGDVLGISVAIDGGTILVAAYEDDIGANADQGSAYVFVRSGASWVEQAKLMASDGEANDLFGVSVAISGDSVVVGAYGDDFGAASAQGSAYVFVRSGANWTQQAKLAASGGAANDWFGYSVAISGDTVVAGAPFGGAMRSRFSLCLCANWNSLGAASHADGIGWRGF